MPAPDFSQMNRLASTVVSNVEALVRGGQGLTTFLEFGVPSRVERKVALIIPARMLWGIQGRRLCPLVDGQGWPLDIDLVYVVKH